MIIYHSNHEGYYYYSPSFIRTSSTTRLWDKVDDDDNDDVIKHKKKALYKVYDEAIELIRLEETVEKTQQVVKDVQNIPNKLKESVEETKQKLDETVEKTQQVVKVVQNFPNKLNESVQETKETIEETVKKTQQVVKDVQNIPNKLNKSVQETKETIGKKVEKTQQVVKDVQSIPNKLNESVQETVSDVKVLVGLKKPTWKQKLRRSQNADKPNTAFGLASKATVTAGKVALWTGKGAASLAGKAAQVAYKKGKETIGPVVEEVWNDQVDTLSSSITATTTTISNLPSKIKSASASRSLTKNKVDNSKSKREESENNIIVNNNPMRKTPYELGKEMKEAQDLAKEISDALEAAEKAMNINNTDRELNDPMIEISPTIIRTSKPTKKVSPSRIDKKNDQISFIKNNIFNNTKNKNKTSNNDRKLTLGDIKFTKSRDELDKEFEEARALAKEVADALEVAEQALMVARSGSSRNESENKST
jgi:chromosome segregation ATPase